MLVKKVAEKRTTEHAHRLIKRAAADPFVTYRHTKEDFNLSISSRTVCRRFVKSKLIARTPRKVLLLKKKARGSKNEFCKEHTEICLFQNDVIFCDLIKLTLFYLGQVNAGYI